MLHTCAMKGTNTKGKENDDDDAIRPDLKQFSKFNG